MTKTVPEGWVRMPTQAFGTHVGPFYRPAEGSTPLCGFVADERHGNKRGVVHGGMLATAFDVALGNASWAAAGQRPSATVQLAVQFVGALQLGEFAIIHAEVVRATRSLVFVRGTMSVGVRGTMTVGVHGTTSAGVHGTTSAGERVVATADGVWKILAWRGEPYVAPPPVA